MNEQDKKADLVNGLHDDMRQTPQTDKQSVYDHGVAVWTQAKKLIEGDWEGMRIPAFFREHHDFIKIHCYSLGAVKEYALYHDCGKPYCIQIDAEGKRHFPNHAEVSAQTYKRVFEPRADVVERLIRCDMDLHTLSAKEIIEKGFDVFFGLTLTIVALAEVHANAEMFGGIGSNNFKAKFKKVERRGKMLTKRYLQIHEESNFF